MLEITLNIEGEDKKFTQGKITLGAMRRMAEMDKRIKELQESSNVDDTGLDVLDEMSYTIVVLFKNQFTFDELQDGLEFETMDEFNEIVEGIFSKVGEGQGKPAPKKTASRKPQTK
ncbi:hypothetical protein [Staphylococcus phage SpP]